MNQQPRHVRLFAAHKNLVKWDGPAWFRTQQGSARRLGTQLSKLTQTCTVVLNEDEKETLQAAAGLLARLGGDFEVAGREAKKYDEQLQRERAKEKQEERDAIGRKFLVGLDASGLADYAQDIQRLVQADEQELAKVLGSAAPRYNHLGLTHGVARLADAVAAGNSIEDEEAARKAIVLWLESSLSDYGHFPAIPAATWLAWRGHRMRMRSLLKNPAFDPADESDGC